MVSTVKLYSFTKGYILIFHGGLREDIMFLSLSLFFLQPHLWHMEVPGLGVDLELQLPAYATAT